MKDIIMKKIFLLFIVTFLSSFTVKVNASSIGFVHPYNGETVTSTGFASTQTTIPVNLQWNQSAHNPFYIKLFCSPYPTQQSNVGGDGISQWWYLPAGTYNWRLELWEGNILGQYFKTAEQTITFYVKHSISATNNFGGGVINIDGGQTSSGSKAYKLIGENLTVGAIDQSYGNYYVWNQSGVNNSYWQKKLMGEQFNLLPNSTPRNYNYAVASNDNGADIQGVLKKRFNISRNDQTEFDGTVAAGVVAYAVDQNNGQISAPLTKIVNGRNYDFYAWSDGDINNPKTIPNVTGNVTQTALYKARLLSSVINGFSSNSQSKVVKTDNGYLHKVYESSGSVWYMRSTNNGTSWQQIQSVNPVGTNAKYPSIAYSADGLDYIYITYQIDRDNFPYIYEGVILAQYNDITGAKNWERTVYDLSSYSYDVKPVVGAGNNGGIVVFKPTSTSSLRAAPFNSSGGISSSFALSFTDANSSIHLYTVEIYRDIFLPIKILIQKLDI